MAGKNNLIPILLALLAAVTALRLLRSSPFRLDDYYYDVSGTPSSRRQLGAVVVDDSDGDQHGNVRGGASDRDRDFRRQVRKGERQRNRLLEKQREQDESVRQHLKDTEDVWMQGLWKGLEWEEEIEVAKEAYFELQELGNHQQDPLNICGRPADVPYAEDSTTLQTYGHCSEITNDKPIFLLEGMEANGRTGNKIIEFLHALQEARDRDLQLGVMAQSWVTEFLTQMWMSVEPSQSSSEWADDFERAFCVKVFQTKDELEGWDVDRADPEALLWYTTRAPLGEYMTHQGYLMRNLFRKYNTGGEGRKMNGRPTQDMCSGINAVLGGGGDDDDEGDYVRSALYSVIHSRTLEGAPGLRLLGKTASQSGCDPTAALEMRPEYIKSILAPLGMMDRPIVFITDGQNSEVLDRLLADPEIGPLVRTVPKRASWIGGDMTLAIMSNVFIGNPASTFTGFIAKSRLALGFGHNHLFRAIDRNGDWTTVCGDHCIYDRTIMGVMA